jgi:hypothetical protein
VAWLPPEEVFLRVIQLPKSDFKETVSMIDLQLEKLSPMPVNQVVWSFELLPQPSAEMQTAVVIIVARQHVEQFLGKLEEQKYLPDRLELPLIDQLLATEVNEDGVWLYPGLGADHYTCLIAWWNGGILRQLSLFPLPPGDDQGRRLQEHLVQISWAGEVEGWLTASPRYHLVATPDLAETWQPFFTAEQPVVVVDPVPADELAARTVRRALGADNRLNLLPSDYASRYRQQLIDRLWIRALMAVGLIYVVGVAIYFGWTQVVRFQHQRLEDQVAKLTGSYTNAVRLKEEVRVLQDQLDLQFAALDAWKAVAEELPTALTLDSLTFERGRTLRLSGTASAGSQEDIISFSEKIQNRTVGDRRLFKDVTVPRTSDRQGQTFWNFSAEMNRAEPE